MSPNPLYIFSNYVTLKNYNEKNFLRKLETLFHLLFIIVIIYLL